MGFLSSFIDIIRKLFGFSAGESSGHPHRETFAEYRGRIGEKGVSRVSDLACFRTTAIPIKNLYLPWPDGKTSQIDEIIIASSGIYVIEMKNYKGWIFGNERNQYWTQVLPDGYTGNSLKYRLYNPIRQNASHIACIRKNLEHYDGPIHSLIVFGNEAEFKDISFFSSNVYVLYLCSLRRVLREIDEQYLNSITPEQINEIHSILMAASASADKSQHVNNIWRIREEKLKKIQDMICPMCGASLVVRTAKSGPNAGTRFLGCTRYPDCKYTHPLL